MINNDILKDIPADMGNLLNEFYSNIDRLKKEWLLCTQQYNIAKGLVDSPYGTYLQKLEVRKVADYWYYRRSSLERVIDKNIINEWLTLV